MVFFLYKIFIKIIVRIYILRINSLGNIVGKFAGRRRVRTGAPTRYKRFDLEKISIKYINYHIDYPNIPG